MSVEKNILLKSVDHYESIDPVLRHCHKDYVFRDDRFYKLIEVDEGVPFHLIFGRNQGEGHFIFYGDGIKKLTGIEPEDFSETLFFEMIEEVISLSGDVPSNLNQIRSRVINGLISDYRLEILIKTPQGDKKWIRETAISLKDDESGRITGVSGIFYDVSERRKILASLEAANEKADQSERLKDTFLQNISHEVRTPLNAIVGFSALLCEPGEVYHTKDEFVKLINNSTDQFLEMMDSILEISRIETRTAVTTFTEINPCHLMERVYNSFKKRAENNNINLAYSCPDSLEDLVIKTDNFKLLQVLSNLVSNAIKFTSFGKVEFGFEINVYTIDFYVIDTGIGIEEEHQPRIFEKFYQAESGITRRYPGVGLGLSISKAYVEMMGGTIGFSSVPGKGSIFRFSLPK